MDYYYINKNDQNNKDHEVHKDGCYWMPEAQHKQYLGYFDNCKDAVKKAKDEGYSKADGCKHCSPTCHTS